MFVIVWVTDSSIGECRRQAVIGVKDYQAVLGSLGGELAFGRSGHETYSIFRLGSLLNDEFGILGSEFFDSSTLSSKTPLDKVLRPIQDSL